MCITTGMSDREEQVKGELRHLFDDMLPKIKKFQKSTYDGVFQDSVIQHGGALRDVSQFLADTEMDQQAVQIHALSLVIPEYAKERLENVKKSERKQLGVNYNLNMAVYVIPLLTYEKDEFLQALAEETVASWNEEKVTSLTLKMSSYDMIRDGFNKRHCYITTAVCERQHKPDDCYELTTFRRFRDTYLCATEEGRTLVDTYYEIAPGIVLIIDMQPDADAIYEQIFKAYLTPCLQLIEEGKNAACRDLYVRMVLDLKQQYFYTQEVAS